MLVVGYMMFWCYILTAALCIYWYYVGQFENKAAETKYEFVWYLLISVL